MKLFSTLTILSTLAGLALSAQAKHVRKTSVHHGEPDAVPVFKCDNAIAPKALIVSLFQSELEVWLKRYDFVNNITIPGLSPLFPFVRCVEDYELCLVTTGESEINAASTVMALTLSPVFDLSKTYFLISGIAGVNPHEGTIGSAAFSRFAISVALQYEVDAREMPKNWTTGYSSYGTDAPGEYPGNWYGTEVLELNANLRDRAADLAKAQVSTLVNSNVSQVFRAKYDYAPANEPPSIITCDSATSDVYYYGAMLGEAFGNWTKLVTNNTATYCVTAQEDTAALESFLRAAKFNLVDYNRIVLMRTASDFDRPPPGMDAVDFFNNAEQGAFRMACDNIYYAGNPFIQDVLNNWDTYENGTVYAPDNYVGDVFGYLGGTPDFGPGSYLTYDYL